MDSVVLKNGKSLVFVSVKKRTSQLLPITTNCIPDVRFIIFQNVNIHRIHRSHIIEAFLSNAWPYSWLPFHIPYKLTQRLSMLDNGRQALIVTTGRLRKILLRYHNSLSIQRSVRSLRLQFRK